MSAQNQYDAAILGATPAGIVCAVRAAREGLNVALISHEEHLGGMLSSGLGVFDTLYMGSRAPLYDELLARLHEHYRSTYGPDSEQLQTFSANLTPEPHAAELVFNDMLAGEDRITVLKVYELVAVERAESRLRALVLAPPDGGETLRVEAAAFVDATYEGDLAALAGVQYRVGRESRDEYGERYAGRVFTRHKYGHFPSAAHDGELNLRVFNFQAEDLLAGSTGEGDDAIQSFNYRLCLSGDPANMRLPERPADYDRTRYLGIVEDERDTLGKRYPVRSLWLIDDIKEWRFGNWKKVPNNKISWNHGNFPGENHAYPRASWPERREIMRRHRDHDLGLLYFLQNDEAVPEHIRLAARTHGLALDEFTDNDNVPWELYIREARRIVGQYVYTEHDGLLAPGLERAPIHADSVAIAEWPLDSHECTTDRRPGSLYDGFVLMTEQTRPSQVSFRVMLPKDLDNLLVTVCISATHIGWGTVRVEPILMQLGEVAGLALTLGARDGLPPGRVSTETLQRLLVERRFLVSFFNDVDVNMDAAWVPAVQYLGTRGFFDSYDAEPDAPLELGVAREWARIAASILAGKGDAGADGRAVAQARTTSTEPVSATTFTQLLERALNQHDLDGPERERLLAEVMADAPATLTRGEACARVYRLLTAATA